MQRSKLTLQVANLHLPASCCPGRVARDHTKPTRNGNHHAAIVCIQQLLQRSASVPYQRLIVHGSDPIPGDQPHTLQSSMTQAQQLNLLQAARPRLHEPSRKVFCPFANLPARDVLKYLPGDVVDAAVLFLGCADGSCLLASLASEHSGLRNPAAVLNDHNPLMLARAALLLLLAFHLNPDSRDDMQVLWEVWYCAVWTPATLARVKPFIEKLQQESVPWLLIPRAQDRETLTHLWSFWLNSDKMSAAKVAKLRDELSVKLRESQADESHGPAVIKFSLQTILKPGSIELASDALSQALGAAPMGGATVPEGDVTLLSVLRSDLSTFIDTGYLAPNYTGQKIVKPRAGNVTMVWPHSPAWCCRFDMAPFFSWGPFSAAEFESAIKSGSPAGVIARLCIARMTETVRAFQRHTQFGLPIVKAASSASAAAAAAVGGSAGAGKQHARLQVQLVCMDALQLCLGMPLTESSSTAAQQLQAQQAAQKQPPGKLNRKQAKAGHQAAACAKALPEAAPVLFDVIDASTLADEISMLPLLVAAGARLKPVPHARLFTSVSKWWTLADTIEDFVCKRALRMSLQLTPTILGLRLLTDLTVEQPETSEAQDYAYRSDAFRELTWVPIPAELQTRPLPQLSTQVLGGPAGSIEAALQAVATQLCCVTDLQPRDRSTPQLLAWLLASMMQRVDMSALLVNNSRGSTSGAGGGSSSSSSSSSGSSEPPSARSTYVFAQRVLWALRKKVAAKLPAQLRLCFVSGIDILRSSLQQNAPAKWQPAGMPVCGGVLPVRLALQLPRAGIIDSPYARPVLADAQMLCQQPKYRGCSPGHVKQTEMIAWTDGGPVPADVHISDMWAADCRQQVQWSPPTQDVVYVYLPRDHGLHLPQTETYISGNPPGMTMQHQREGKVIQASSVLAQVLLPAACPVTAAAHSQSTCQEQPSGVPWSLRIARLEEHADSYRAELQLQANKVSCSAACPQPPILPSSLQVLADGHQVACYSQIGSNSSLSEQRQCSTAHKVVVGLCEPAGQVQPAELQLCWPVAVSLNETDWVLPDSYSGSFSIFAFGDPEAGTIVLNMAKAQVWELWPNDKAWHMTPGPLDLAALRPLPEHAHPSLQHEGAKQYHPKLDKEHGAPKGSHINTTRMLLEQLMRAVPRQLQPAVNSSTAPLCFRAAGGYTAADGTPKVAEVYIRLHPPILLTPAGRPVLPCTVMDMSMCEGASTQGTLHQATLDNLLCKLGFTPGQKPQRKLALSDGCRTLRRMLYRRAHAFRPTAAQRQILPDGGRFPYYYNSYVSFTQYQSTSYLCMDPEPELVGPRGTLTHTTYLRHRLEELLAECTQKETYDDKAAVISEIQQLLAQDTGRTLPASLVERAQTLVNMLTLTEATIRDSCQQAAVYEACVSVAGHALAAMLTAATPSTAAAAAAARAMAAAEAEALTMPATATATPAVAAATPATPAVTTASGVTPVTAGQQGAYSGEQGDGPSLYGRLLQALQQAVTGGTLETAQADA